MEIKVLNQTVMILLNKWTLHLTQSNDYLLQGLKNKVEWEGEEQINELLRKMRKERRKNKGNSWCRTAHYSLITTPEKKVFLTLILAYSHLWKLSEIQSVSYSSLMWKVLRVLQLQHYIFTLKSLTCNLEPKTVILRWDLYYLRMKTL